MAKDGSTPQWKRRDGEHRGGRGLAVRAGDGDAAAADHAARRAPRRAAARAARARARPRSSALVSRIALETTTVSTPSTCSASWPDVHGRAEHAQLGERRASPWRRCRTRARRGRAAPGRCRSCRRRRCRRGAPGRARRSGAARRRAEASSGRRQDQAGQGDVGVAVAERGGGRAPSRPAGRRRAAAAGRAGDPGGVEVGVGDEQPAAGLDDRARR